MKEEAYAADVFEAIWKLRRESGCAYLSYVDEDGYPVTRAMLILEHGQMQTQYLSTNTSSGKIESIVKNPKASIYYCDPAGFQGALFVGDIEVCMDTATRELLWRDGFEKYYPKGVTGPDYCVLKLTVKHGSHYHGLRNTHFTPDELEA